ncbi:HAMP domain-containing histidine kinase [bacterium]|nr:HAMP domain-containing histidine kinase [bacterium]
MGFIDRFEVKNIFRYFLNRKRLPKSVNTIDIYENLPSFLYHYYENEMSFSSFIQAIKKRFPPKTDFEKELIEKLELIPYKADSLNLLKISNHLTKLDKAINTTNDILIKNHLILAKLWVFTFNWLEGAKSFIMEVENYQGFNEYEKVLRTLNSAPFYLGSFEEISQRENFLDLLKNLLENPIVKEYPVLELKIIYYLALKRKGENVKSDLDFNLLMKANLNHPEMTRSLKNKYYNQLANFTRQQGYFTKSVVYSFQALELSDTKIRELENYLGIIGDLILMEQFELAQDFFNQYINSKKNEITFYPKLAQKIAFLSINIQNGLKNWEKFFNECDEYLALYPKEEGTILFFKAKAYTELMDIENFTEIYHKISSELNNSLFFSVKFQAFYKQEVLKDLAGAIEILKNSKQYFTDKKQDLYSINETLGNLYLKIGDYQNAFIIFQDCRTIAYSLFDEFTKEFFELSEHIKNKSILDLLNTVLQNSYKIQLVKSDFLLDKLNSIILLQNEQLEKANEHIKRVQLFKNDYWSTIAHDLNNPFTIIKGGIDILKMKLEEECLITNSYLDEFAQKLSISIETSLQLLENINEIIKLEDNKLQLKLLSADLINVAKTAYENIDDGTEKFQNVKFHFENTLNDKVLLDEKLILRVFINLYTNAIKFTEIGFVNIFISSLNDEYALVTVSDTGRGIPTDKFDIIFEKYGQVEKVALRGVKSSGLGLYYCKLAIEAHGGKIWADKNDKVGATFKFQIPKKK